MSSDCPVVCHLSLRHNGIGNERADLLECCHGSQCLLQLGYNDIKADGPGRRARVHQHCRAGLTLISVALKEQGGVQECLRSALRWLIAYANVVWTAIRAEAAVGRAGVLT